MKHCVKASLHFFFVSQDTIVPPVSKFHGVFPDVELHHTVHRSGRRCVAVPYICIPPKYLVPWPLTWVCNRVFRTSSGLTNTAVVPPASANSRQSVCNSCPQTPCIAMQLQLPRVTYQQHLRPGHLRCVGRQGTSPVAQNKRISIRHSSTDSKIRYAADSISNVCLRPLAHRSRYSLLGHQAVLFTLLACTTTAPRSVASENGFFSNILYELQVLNANSAPFSAIRSRY